MHNREKVITLIFGMLLLIALAVVIINLKKVEYELLNLQEMIITQFNMITDLPDRIIMNFTELPS